MLKLKRESALDLPLEGSIGSFNVGTGRPGQNSVEVKYFLTHVGLDFASGPNEKVLSHLAPVREMFDFEQLDFDEIMQRDIDDARVSGELIPYLLDSRSSDLIKLFPPIIVVVLPLLEQQNRPSEYYPQVTVDKLSPEPEEEAGKLITRAGTVGQEVFQFEQPLMDGQALNHDLVRFRINTQRTKLVIVDGQHRAMALLALYRNLRDEWSDARRVPFKEYYAEWTKNYIRQYNLKHINLPVMFCTFPQLCEGYTGDLNLKKAARAIFLTLNKTARKVSNSRNILLDDNNIIPLFLRRCLSEVKRKDSRSRYSFRIFNVELDQFEDRMKILSPIAITGVNHLHYIIEHLMLNKGAEDVNGAKPRTGKFYNRKDLDRYGLMNRLSGRDLIGAEAADATRRDSFGSTVGRKLADVFQSKYGSFVLRVFEEFIPFERHNRAVLALETRLETHEDRKLRPILFEGQGIGRVFQAHRENLKQKLRDGEFETDIPKIEELSRQLDATAERIGKSLGWFKDERASKYLESVTDKRLLKDKDSGWKLQLLRILNDLYENVIFTVAFQAAVICGFFGEIEKTNRSLRKKGSEELDVEECFGEYIQQLNSFFIPKTFTQTKRLVRLFVGEVDEKSWKIAQSKITFRAIVYRGEMQPDQWPKYKYLISEIWKPSQKELEVVMSGEREKCRKQIFTSLYDDYRTHYAREAMKPEDALDSKERKEIADNAFDSFKGFLKVVGVSGDDAPRKRDMQANLEGVFEDAEADEEPEESERWESVDIENVEKKFVP